MRTFHGDADEADDDKDDEPDLGDDLTTEECSVAAIIEDCSTAGIIDCRHVR